MRPERYQASDCGHQDPDEQGEPEPQDQSGHLTAQLGLGRGDDEPAERWSALVEIERMGDREERAVLAGRGELELERLAAQDRVEVDGRLSEEDAARSSGRRRTARRRSTGGCRWPSRVCSRRRTAARSLAPAFSAPAPRRAASGRAPRGAAPCAPGSACSSGRARRRSASATRPVSAIPARKSAGRRKRSDLNMRKESGHRTGRPLGLRPGRPFGNGRRTGCTRTTLLAITP